MKKIIISLTMLALFVAPIFGCPVCERNQPKLLKGLVHGAGPDGMMDYLIVGLITLISLITLFLSIKWLVKPGERGADHIKRSILNMYDHD